MIIKSRLNLIVEKIKYMKVLKDFENRRIRLTDERLKHILAHPEMIHMIGAIEETLVSPQRVVQSMSDEDARMYYRFYIGTKVGDKYLCVVVKLNSDDAFVLTAYLTDKIKKGMKIWPKNS